MNRVPVVDVWLGIPPTGHMQAEVSDVVKQTELPQSVQRQVEHVLRSLCDTKYLNAARFSDLAAVCDHPVQCFG